MRAYSEYWLVLLFLAMVGGIYYFLGWRVALFAFVLSTLWFGIIFILATRPPGIPEFVSDEVGSDEQHVVRRDVLPKLPVMDRLRLALAAACGSSFLLWITLALLGR